MTGEIASRVIAVQQESPTNPTPGQRAKSEMFGMPLFATGHVYGMGVAVVMEPDRASPTLCGGGVARWVGQAPMAAGGRPILTTNSVAIFLAHNMFELDQLANGIGLSVYGTITQFQALLRHWSGHPKSGSSHAQRPTQ